MEGAQGCQPGKLRIAGIGKGSTEYSESEADLSESLRSLELTPESHRPITLCKLFLIAGQKEWLHKSASQYSY